MPIRFLCQACESRMKVPDGSHGRKVKCPKCGMMQLVPSQVEIDKQNLTDAGETKPKQEPAGEEKPVAEQSASEEKSDQHASEELKPSKGDSTPKEEDQVADAPEQAEASQPESKPGKTKATRKNRQRAKKKVKTADLSEADVTEDSARSQPEDSVAEVAPPAEEAVSEANSETSEPTAGDGPDVPPVTEALDDPKQMRQTEEADGEESSVIDQVAEEEELTSSGEDETVTDDVADQGDTSADKQADVGEASVEASASYEESQELATDEQSLPTSEQPPATDAVEQADSAEPEQQQLALSSETEEVDEPVELPGSSGEDSDEAEDSQEESESSTAKQVDDERPAWSDISSQVESASPRRGQRTRESVGASLVSVSPTQATVRRASKPVPKPFVPSGQSTSQVKEKPESTERKQETQFATSARAEAREKTSSPQAIKPEPVSKEQAEMPKSKADDARVKAASQQTSNSADVSSASRPTSSTRTYRQQIQPSEIKVTGLAGFLAKPTRAMKQIAPAQMDVVCSVTGVALFLVGTILGLTKLIQMDWLGAVGWLLLGLVLLILLPVLALMHRRLYETEQKLSRIKPKKKE